MWLQLRDWRTGPKVLVNMDRVAAVQSCRPAGSRLILTSGISIVVRESGEDIGRVLRTARCGATVALEGADPDASAADRSGRTAVASWINSRLGLDNGDILDENDKRVGAVFDHIAAEYDAGGVAVMRDKEMFELIAEHIPDLAARVSGK